MRRLPLNHVTLGGRIFCMTADGGACSAQLRPIRFAAALRPPTGWGPIWTIGYSAFSHPQLVVLIQDWGLSLLLLPCSGS